MKKAKKLLALALAMSMTVGLAACSSGGTDTPSGESTAPVGTEAETPAAGGEGNKLIAGIVFQEDQFFKLLSAGYQAAADEYGMPGNLVVGANIAGFLKIADAMLAQGV